DTKSPCTLTLAPSTVCPDTEYRCKSGTICSATCETVLITADALRVARSRSGVTRPITQIASAKMPDKNGVENDEKKIATAATTWTSNHASTIAFTIALDTPTPCRVSMPSIATANTPTSTLSTSTMPKY